MIAATPSLPELPASCLGDENALNLLPGLAVERLFDNGRRIATTGDDDVEPVVNHHAVGDGLDHDLFPSVPRTVRRSLGMPA